MSLIPWNEEGMLPGAVTDVMPFAMQHKPSIEINNTPEAIFVYVVAPDLEREDFVLELKNDVLTISLAAEAAPASWKTGQRLLRSFALPPNINEAQAKATCEQGVLTIILPKR